jgi:hypothetical protein
MLKSVFSQVESRWSEWRRKHAVREAVNEHPILAKWLDSLPTGYREHAQGVIAKVNSIPMDDTNDRKEILKHAVLAFERLKLKGFADALESAINIGAENLLKLLADQDAIEASLYRDIVKSRLDTIRAFNGLIEENAKERVLQEYLFRDLWLLDASWERAAGSEKIESRLREEKIIVDDLSEKERLGRVDIRYKTAAGEHIIVELKRYKKKVTEGEIVTQGKKYYRTLRKILVAAGYKNIRISVVFILGKLVDSEGDEPGSLEKLMESISSGSRVVYYDALIEGALKSYAEYLEKDSVIDRITAIVEGI